MGCEIWEIWGHVMPPVCHAKTAFAFLIRSISFRCAIAKPLRSRTAIALYSRFLRSAQLAVVYARSASRERPQSIK